MTRRLSISHLLFLALAVASLLLGIYVSAQSKATVRIPFQFTANHQTLPPGQYTVELLSDRFLCFTDSQSGKHQAVIMVQPQQLQYIETRGALTFVVEGYRHYLTEVRFANSSAHSAPVLQQSLAREIAKNSRAAAPVEIAMR